MLSGKKEEEVKRYFQRSLKRRGKAKLIVNTEKDFSLIYKLIKGSLLLGFILGFATSMVSPSTHKQKPFYC